jgi:hypothetical protein
MKVITLKDEAMYEVIDQKHKPAIVQNQKEENQFQAEKGALYARLVELLSQFPPREIPL